MKDLQRTIQTVLSLKTGNSMEANDFFSNENEEVVFRKRSEIEKQIQTKDFDWVCIYCKQPISISGGGQKLKTLYFKHLKNSDDCIIKTGNNLTEEQVRCIKYNGVKESEPHKYLKNFIGEKLALNENISVIIDKVFQDKAISMEWRKPDVLATLKDKKIAFELQLSTTFLSVIVARNEYYKNHNIFIIWVFPYFTFDTEWQSFTQKDVYYNNSLNVFVLDEDAQRESNEQNNLVLKCYYKEVYEDLGNIYEQWTTKLITINDLTFDLKNYRVIYYDLELERENLKSKIELNKQQGLINNKIDKAVTSIKDFYKLNDSALYSNHNYPNLDFIDTEEEIEKLNQRLRFSVVGESLSLLSNLFYEYSNPKFLKFLFEEKRIFINPNLIQKGEKSLFEEIIFWNEPRHYDTFLLLIFYRDYQLTNRDLLIIENLYKENYMQKNDIERKIMEKYVYCKCLINLKTRQRANELREIEHILFPIASLKEKIIIKYKFQNLRQITNIILTNYKMHGDIYIKAMKVYDEFDKQIIEDKSGNTRKIIDNFLNNKPQQVEKYNSLIEELFPELKNS